MNQKVEKVVDSSNPIVIKVWENENFCHTTKESFYILDKTSKRYLEENNFDACSETENRKKLKFLLGHNLMFLTSMEAMGKNQGSVDCFYEWLLKFVEDLRIANELT